METVGSRFKYFGEVAFGGNKTAFANALGWEHPAAMYKYLNDTSIPGGELLKKLHDLGCNINWLLVNIGEIFAENEAGQKLREDYFKKVKVAGAITPETEKEKNHREIEHERS